MNPSQKSSPAAPPPRRITQEALLSAAVEAPESAGLPDEEPLTAHNHVLELRLYWGEVLLAMHHYVRPKAVTLGEEKGADIFLSSDGLPEAPFAVVRTVDDDYVLRFCRGMEGEVVAGDDTVDLAQVKRRGLAHPEAESAGTYEMVMQPQTRALLHWGGATVAMRFVPPAALLPVRLGQRLDFQYLNAALLSWVGHGLLLATLLLMPPAREALSIDLFAQPNRMAQLIVAPPPPTPASVATLKRMQRQLDSARPPAASSSSRAPRSRATRHDKPAGSKTRVDASASVAEKFRSMLGSGHPGGAGTLLGGGGGNLAGAAQNVISTQGAASARGGVAGLGVRGGGPLTGGGAGTQRGIAGIGTAGKLGGGSKGYGAGVGLGDAQGHPVVALEVPQIEGALAAEVIKKVIDANRRQIQACYEEELQRLPSLSGRVVVGWVIGGDGRVVSTRINETSMHNATVEKCMMRHIRTWKFPAPAGGGTVQVNYPFVFRAS